MEDRTLKNKYFIRKSTSDNWTDITEAFYGVRILKLDGFNEVGDAVNVYTEQWVNSQEEDFYVGNKDRRGKDLVIRKNVDLQMTIIISRRYVDGGIDEQTTFNELKTYLLNRGDFYIKSAYTGLQAHVICIKGFKPTAQNLNRGNASYILATIPLHCLDEATEAE